MKRLLSVLLVLCMLFIFGACNQNVSDDTDKKNITLCLDWTPNTNHTGFYVALAKGYYEQAGIDLAIVQPPEDGAEIMTASGQAQFGITFQDTVAAYFAAENPLEITAVSAILQHNTSGIITRKGEGGERPKGLEGKRYSTWNSPIEIATIKSVMESDGGDFNKLELLPNVVTNEAEALKNKDTDAIWIFYAWAGISCELNGLDFDYFQFTDIDPVFDYYTPIIVANNDFLKNDPNTAVAFLEATKKGYQYAIDNPEEAAQILINGDTTGSLKGSEEFVTESQKWISTQYIADSQKWGYIDSERWDRFYSWLYDNKLIEKDITGYGYTNDYLF